MTTRPVAGVRFGRTAPTVPVTDLEQALAFYVGRLGMTEIFRNGDPIGFVIVERDAAEIHLSLRRDHRATTENVFHLMVDDATALFEHVRACGVRIVKGIRDADYGLRTFVMADPDGNRIAVGEDL
jgi:catechol 2,3-dioxygenase-like lactoylglutathione lyase family enzyme